MASFARGEADVLVATTVIEVGVDVPNATLMVIEDADRFGLSQLHQLRGRVGRGKAKSYCILTTHNRNLDTIQRLKALCKTTDGFKIAALPMCLCLAPIAIDPAAASIARPTAIKTMSKPTKCPFYVDFIQKRYTLPKNQR